MAMRGAAAVIEIFPMVRKSDDVARPIKPTSPGRLDSNMADYPSYRDRGYPPRDHRDGDRGYPPPRPSSYQDYPPPRGADRGGYGGYGGGGGRGDDGGYRSAAGPPPAVAPPMGYDDRRGPPKTTLFVAGFPPEMRAADLAYYFERLGPLVRCDIPALKNAQSKPYAFVEYEDPRDAAAAHAEMHGVRFGGFAISLQFAKNSPSANWRFDGAPGQRGPPPPPPPASAGYGGGGGGGHRRRPRSPSPMGRRGPAAAEYDDRGYSRGPPPPRERERGGPRRDFDRGGERGDYGGSRGGGGGGGRGNGRFGGRGGGGDRRPRGEDDYRQSRGGGEDDEDRYRRSNVGGDASAQETGAAVAAEGERGADHGDQGDRAAEADADAERQRDNALTPPPAVLESSAGDDEDREPVDV